MSSLLLVILFLTILVYYFLIGPLFIHPLSKIPGPKLYAATKWRLAVDDWRGNRTTTINKLHRRYGPAVRIGPNEVHFNSLSALRTIYGAGSGYERTSFYRMFDVYGRQNLFTFRSSKRHADRKKLLANAYSKSSMMKAENARMIEDKVRQYLEFIATKAGKPDEIFTSLHYFSIDNITHFVYGPKYGGTSSMLGDPSHRALLGDILDPSRRRLSWFVVHLTALTKWMYTRVGVMERLLQPALPMQKPATYTSIREHALRSWQTFKASTTADTEEVLNKQPGNNSIMSLLYKHHTTQPTGHLEDLDIASECADHLLAGIDTTADTVMFLIWALSLPANKQYQSKLINELHSLTPTLFNADGILPVELADKLVYLNAIIKETLRLYTPLPAMEPRYLRSDSIINSYIVPAGTIVGMSPFSLHRNDKVFKDPLRFNPDRWIPSSFSSPATSRGADQSTENNLLEMNKWFWAFSSGARMCIGMHIAMAEMTTLVAAVYKKYGTSVASGFEGVSPAITSRFELFCDEGMGGVKEHECWIDFTEHTTR